ncbi:hypothetical protein LEMLEM_LOCUS14523 [Lemmus lemmus]
MGRRDSIKKRRGPRLQSGCSSPSFHLGPEEPHPGLKMNRCFCYVLSTSPLKPQVAP